MSARMTRMAHQRGVKNALMCGVGLIIFLGILAGVISVVLQQPVHESIMLAFGLSLIIIFSWFFFSWIYNHFKKGALIIDCGPHPARFLFFVQAIIFAGIYLSGGFTLITDNFGVAGQFFGPVMVVYWIIMACGRLQIRENGIWVYWGLMNCSKLQSYYWEGNHDLTLMIQTKTLFPFMGRGAIPVSAEHKQAFDKLLRKHCPSDDET